MSAFATSSARRRGGRDGLAKPLDLFAARDDADLRVVAASDAHPMAPDPIAVARDDRFAGAQVAA